MARCAVLLMALGLVLAGCRSEPEETQSEATTTPPEHSAEAPPPSHETPAGAPGAETTVQLIAGDPASGVAGTVTFKQEQGGVRVVADVSGLKPGRHGFHIHENGVCEPPFESAGNHLNPYSIVHACTPENLRHLGDLGNLEVGPDGKGHYDQVVDKISLIDPYHQIAGKSVIIHETEDDCKTQPTGNSGARLACGVIQPPGGHSPAQP